MKMTSRLELEDRWRAVRSSLGVLLALCIFSCDDGMQGGRYVMNGHLSFGLAEGGFIDVISGCPFDRQAGPPTPLFSVLVLHPVFEAQVASGGSGSHGSKYVSTFERKWELVNGRKRSFSYSWDRRDHSVTVDGQKFSLDTSNVLVVTLDAAWKPTVQQGTSVETVTSAKDDGSMGQAMLSATQRQFPKDERVLRARVKH